MTEAYCAISLLAIFTMGFCYVLFDMYVKIRSKENSKEENK